jgi:hypothetical protein
VERSEPNPKKPTGPPHHGLFRAQFAATPPPISSSSKRFVAVADSQPLRGVASPMCSSPAWTTPRSVIVAWGGSSRWWWPWRGRTRKRGPRTACRTCRGCGTPSISTPSPAASSHSYPASTRGALLMLQRCPCDRFNWRLTIAFFYFAVRKRMKKYSADTVYFTFEKGTRFLLSWNLAWLTWLHAETAVLDGGFCFFNSLGLRFSFTFQLVVTKSNVCMVYHDKRA